jgi:hypothetical protein
MGGEVVFLILPLQILLSGVAGLSLRRARREGRLRSRAVGLAALPLPLLLLLIIGLILATTAPLAEGLLLFASLLFFLLILWLIGLGAAKIALIGAKENGA